MIMIGKSSAPRGRTEGAHQLLFARPGLQSKPGRGQEQAVLSLVNLYRFFTSAAKP
jgi:hypothetical protein